MLHNKNDPTTNICLRVVFIYINIVLEMQHVKCAKSIINQMA